MDENKEVHHPILFFLLKKQERYPKE